jgi:hypothetical protein
MLGPGRADRQSRHRGNVEAAANNLLELGETAALAQCLATPHCAEQRVIEALHGIAAAGRRGMERTRIKTENEPTRKSDGFP